MPTGRLIIVPTPIGNLGDITLRAIKSLRLADSVLAEDTRTARILLDKYKIKKPLYSFHVKNERTRCEDVLRKLREGKNIALISESGTPCISDPGHTLVRRCIAEGLPIEVLPGPTAFVPALILSGLPIEPFSFEGFLPHSGKGRRRRLRQIAEESPRTLVFYVSPHNVRDVIDDIIAILGDRQSALSRELTKVHEETIRGKLSEIAGNIAEPRGEMVLVVGRE